jgi:hypothetical protein
VQKAPALPHRTARPVPRDRAQRGRRCARHLPSASFLYVRLTRLSIRLSSLVSLTASLTCKMPCLCSSALAAGSIPERRHALCASDAGESSLGFGVLALTDHNSTVCASLAKSEMKARPCMPVVPRSQTLTCSRTSSLPPSSLTSDPSHASNAAPHTACTLFGAGAARAASTYPLPPPRLTTIVARQVVDVGPGLHATSLCVNGLELCIIISYNLNFSHWHT